MTRKLRYKFIGFASGAVALLLVLILGVINLTNFGLVASSGDEVTATLASKGGRFEDKGPNSGGSWGEGGEFSPVPSRPDAPDSPDMQGSVRYFTVSFDNNGNPFLLATRFQMLDETTAISYAQDVHGKGVGVGWYATYYRYRCYVYEGKDYVSFIDESRELSPSYNVLYASIAGGLGGILVTFLLLIPLSKILVKPTEEAWRKQKRFVSDASHELKTPLSIISANNEINELSNGENEQTKAISKQVKVMNKLVKNLNSLAKLEEGEALKKSDIDLSLVVTEIAKGLQSKDKTGKSMTLDIQENLSFHGEESSIRALYQTVLENAFKYGLTTISLSLHKEGDHIRTLIDNDANLKENGPLDIVFERFYRSEEARASDVEGSGIGLSMAKEIVSAHKGKISARGENGHFILTIEL